MGFLTFAIIRQMWADRNNPPSPIPTDLTFAGRTILVTGASGTGLGFEACMAFAKHKASHIILAVRSPPKGDEAAQRIRDAHPETKTTVMQVDMSSYDSIQRFVHQLEKEVDRLDIALLNAGVVAGSHRTSEETGWEETIMVNAIGTSLLALLLLPKLRAARPALRAEAEKESLKDFPGAAFPHLSIVSSSSHLAITKDSPIYEAASKDESILRTCSQASFKGRYDDQSQYATSKFMLMWAVPHLLEAAGSDVIFTTCCPGATRSDLGRDIKGPVVNLAKKLFLAVLTRTTEEGARTLVSSCILGEDSRGAWWVDDTSKPQNPLLTAENGSAMSDKLWAEMLADWSAKDIDVNAASGKS